MRLNAPDLVATGSCILPALAAQLLPCADERRR